MIPAVVTDPASGNPVVVASLERQRVKVEKDIQDACNEFLNEPDWNKNMGIVDSLNRSPYLCPFAIKEIRKQLKTKNPEIEILALQLTETIIKNCPASHAAVAQEDFMRYLVKVGLDQRQGGKWTQLKSKIGKKKNESKHVRSQCIEKALLILKMLAIAYEESHLYPVFKATYKQLQRNKEVRFPETNKDESLNVFSPMHSSNAPDEFAGPTAMGSVQNVNLPMIRPVIIMENVKDPTLVQAQESAQVLFEMINAPVLSFELIPDLTQMLQQSQQQIVVMISEGNAPESVLMQALQINDKVNQVLEDAQAIANGTKRRYQEEVNVARLMLQHSDSQNDVDAKDANDDDDDEPRLEESVSIEEADKDYNIKQPDKDKLNKKRPSKKSKRQSIDLLGMNSVDLMSAQERNPKPQKKESEDDLMGFLGIQQDENNNNGNVKPQPPKPTVFDPLEDDSNPPPPAYTGANYGNNNGNVFRQNNGNYNNGNYNNNNGNYNNNNGNYNNNNGNYNNNNNNNNNVNLFKPNNNNNNNTQTKGQTQGASHRKLNTIARGNQSVLDVLTGEKSPTQSDPNSSNSSIKPSPQQNKQQQPKQEYNLGGPTPPKPANNIQKTKNADDPFADMDDPFADMGGATFDDVMNSDQKSPGKPQQAQQQPKPKPKPKPKPQPKPIVNDPFSDMAGSAFDDPALSMISNEPKKQQPKPQPVPPKPAPPKHQDSNAIILGMLESGAPPDPNDQKQSQYNKPQQQQKQQQKKDDNPFAMDNPFGSDNNVSNNNNASDNPFDALDDPFGDDGLADNQGNADPSNPFDSLENPFADM